MQSPAALKIIWIFSFVAVIIIYPKSRLWIGDFFFLLKNHLWTTIKLYSTVKYPLFSNTRWQGNSILKLREKITNIYALELLLLLQNVFQNVSPFSWRGHEGRQTQKLMSRLNCMCWYLTLSQTHEVVSHSNISFSFMFSVYRATLAVTS